MTEAQKFARVAVTMGRTGWGRHAGHSATVGTLTGRGTSVAGALADLGRLITLACERDASDAVSFAWDDENGGLWVAVPDVLHGGHTEHMVSFRPDGSPFRARSLMSSGSKPARDAFADCAGFAAVTDQAGQQHAPRALPAMPAEVREMLSDAADALSPEADDDSTYEALRQLADYVSGQYAPSELTR
jgi:hypothetical protein